MKTCNYCGGSIAERLIGRLDEARNQWMLGIEADGKPYCDPECAVRGLARERDALRAQNAALARLANTALIFIDIFAADKIDDEYNRVLINPLQAAIAAAEGGAE